MSWFLKRSSPRAGEEIRWNIRLRLTRWRHLLAAEWTCFDQLADLREKLNGEFIFDRQYIYSTLGRIFQAAYRVAHDRGILGGSKDPSMYLWLDPIQEDANSYVRGFTGPASARAKEVAVPTVSGEAGARLPDLDSEAWVEEPEFLIIRDILEMLDPADRGAANSASDVRRDEIAFREGLQLAHEAVLHDLIKPDRWQDWIRDEVARPCGSGESYPLFVIDVEPMTTRPISPNGSITRPTPASLQATPWIPLAEGLASFQIRRDPAQERRLSPLFMVASASTLFLTGSWATGALYMDAALTSIRECNHCFLRLEGGCADIPHDPIFDRLFASACRTRPGTHEILCFNQTAGEVAAQLRDLGEFLASCARSETLQRELDLGEPR